MPGKRKIIIEIEKHENINHLFKDLVFKIIIFSDIYL